MILLFNEYHSSFRVGAEIRDDTTGKLYKVIDVDYDLKYLNLQSVEDEEDGGAPELFQSLIQIANAI